MSKVCIEIVQRKKDAAIALETKEFLQYFIWQISGIRCAELREKLCHSELVERLVYYIFFHKLEKFCDYY